MSQKVKDYISLPIREFKRKYANDQKRFIRNVDSLEFNIGHLVEPKLDDIENRLRGKDFSEEYISQYLNNSKTPTEETKDPYLESLSIYFKHKGKKIRPKDIKEGLKINNITRIKGHNDEEIKSVINSIKTSYPDLSDSLSVLEAKLESDVKDTEKITIDIEDIIGEPDPRLTKTRKKIYKYYKGKAGLYNEIKEAIKEILVAWDRVEEEFEGKGENRKSTGKLILTEGLREDLDTDLEKLHKVYDEMEDNLNYIVRTKAIKIPHLPDNDEGSSLIASNIIWSYLNSIMGGKEINVESELQDEDDEPADEDDDRLKEFMAGYEGEEGESGPDLRTTEYKPTEEDSFEQEWSKEIGALSVIEYADPLFAIAASDGQVKHSINENSASRLISTIKTLINQLEEEDSSVKGTFAELLEEMEELHDQVNDAKQGDIYYLPYVTRLDRLLTDNGINDFNYERIETHHEKIIKTINEIIELPENKTLLPYHWTQDDFIEGSGKTGDVDIAQNVVFTATETGRSGALKDLGEFTDGIIRLISLAEEYYADPITDNMLPFKSLPKFLNRRDLSAITTHGKKDVAHILQQVYIENYTAFITPSELEEINDYREILNAPPSDRSFTATLSSIEEILDILEDIFPKDKDKDRKYFANKLNSMARHNSNIKLSEYKLQGKKLNELVTDEKVKGNYPKLIAMIYAFSSEMKKDKNKEEEVTRFKRLHEAFDDKIKLSDTQDKLLTAYDAIRKMMDKPIYYGVSELDSFDNVNDTIDIIKEEHNIELSVNDITNIVEEVDSLESIAKKHGTNEDVIYHVKALYR